MRMYRKVSQTHSEVMLRPPPGTRFTIFGSDVHLQFQTGREKEIVSWLRNWISTYIEPYINAQTTVAHEPSPQPQPQPSTSFACICGTTNGVHSDACDKIRALNTTSAVTQPVAQPAVPVAPKPKFFRETLKEIADREFAKLTSIASNGNPEVNKEESDNHGKSE